MSQQQNVHISELATTSQPALPSLADSTSVIVQGGVAVATIVAVTYLVRTLVRLIEAVRKPGEH